MARSTFSLFRHPRRHPRVEPEDDGCKLSAETSRRHCAFHLYL